MNEKLETQVVTPKFRMSWPSLLAAKTNKLNGKEQYELTMVFPEGADLTELKKAAANAAKNKWGDKIPGNLRSPFRSGDEDTYKKYPEFAGKVIIRASTSTPPGVVDHKVQPVMDGKEVYGGRWAIAQVNAGAYDQAGNRGVAFYLNHVQILDHDKSFGGASRPEDIFQKTAIQGTAATTNDEGDIFG